MRLWVKDKTRTSGGELRVRFKFMGHGSAFLLFAGDPSDASELSCLGRLLGRGREGEEQRPAGDATCARQYHPLYRTIALNRLACMHKNRMHTSLQVLAAGFFVQISVGENRAAWF